MYVHIFVCTHFVRTHVYVHIFPGEILDENDQIRTLIRDMREENVLMEERDIDVLQTTDTDIRAIRVSFLISEASG